MKIKLNIVERDTLASLIPTEENYLTYKMIKVFREKLIISDEEKKKGGASVVNSLVYWKDITISKDIEIPDVILSMIIEKLKHLEKEKKINERNCSLYEKLVLNIK